MTISIQLPEKQSLKPSITVFGVGGGGGNAVNNMIATELEGVSFVVANTDALALDESLCKNHIQLGESITQGLGAGSYPEVGKASAEEAVDEILDYLQGSNMIFITAGLGGGTGTGAAPVVARLAKERGILTVAVVTKPFNFEGTHRMRVAELGLEELQKYVDTLIVIPNQNLFRVADKNTTFLDAFKLADDVLHAGVRGVTDLMTMPGLINLDFSDVRSVMSEMGKAMMGTGEAAGDGRAIQAAEAAIANPLLDNVSMQGARGVLINITGGYDMTLFEVDEAANRIKEEVDPEANIIFGSTFDKDADGVIRVSVVATGIDLSFDSMDRMPERKSASSYTVVDNNAAAEPAKQDAQKKMPLFPQQQEEQLNYSKPADTEKAAENEVQQQPIAPKVDATPEKSEGTSLFGGGKAPEKKEKVEENDDLGDIESMTLSDVLGKNKSNAERSKAEVLHKLKEAPFVLPESIDPSAMADGNEKDVAASVSSAGKENVEGQFTQGSTPNDAPLKMPEGIYDSRQKATSGGSIFGGLFGASKKKGEDVLPDTSTQNVTTNSPTPPQEVQAPKAEKQDEDLDIPAFLRRKN